MRVALRTLLLILFLINGSPICAQINPQKEASKESHSNKISIDDVLSVIFSHDYNSIIEGELALYEMANKDHLLHLTDTLKNGNSEHVQTAIIRTIAKLSDKRASETLRFEIKHGKEFAKIEAIKALGQIGDDWAVPLLFSLLESNKSSPNISYFTALALAQIDSKKSFAALSSLRKQIGDFRKEYLKNVIDYLLANSSFNSTQPKPIETIFHEGRKVRLEFEGLQYLFSQPPLKRRINFYDNRKWGKMDEVYPLVICIPDRLLNYQEVYKNCRGLASAMRAVLVVPIIDPLRFSNYELLNYRSDRFDLMLLKLVDHLKANVPINSSQFYIAGFGYGGDAALNFTLAHPTRINRAYVRPNRFPLIDGLTYFPKGLKSSPYATDLSFDLQEIIKVKLAIALPTSTKLEKIRKSGELFFHGLKDIANSQSIRSNTALRNFPEDVGFLRSMKIDLKDTKLLGELDRFWLEATMFFIAGN